MSIAKQLYQLQEVDIELERAESAVQHIKRQIDECAALTAARTRLAAAKQHLTELNLRQRSLDLDLDSINTRLKKIEEELFSGHVRNQKELAALQREDENLKTNRGNLESRELLVMEESDLAGKNLKIAEIEFQSVAAGWEKEKIKLTADLEQATSVLAEVSLRRRQLAALIEQPVLTVYQDLKRTRGKAVVAVERGICTGCRIAQSVTDLQKIRSGQLVRCGSCGRILHS